VKLPVLLPMPVRADPPGPTAPDLEPAVRRSPARALTAAAPAAIFLAALTAGTAAAVALGYWWVTPLVGVAIGAILPWPRLAAGVSGAAGLAAWGVPLLWLAVRAPVGRTAAVVAAIMGLAGIGAIGPVVLTLLVGVLLCVSGAWVGLAARKFVDPWLEKEQ
jgi:hypothetical protein